MTNHAVSVSLCVTNVSLNVLLSGQEPHRQVELGSMVTSGSLGGEMVSTWGQNTRYMGSIPALGKLFPIFITPTS